MKKLLLITTVLFWTNFVQSQRATLVFIDSSRVTGTIASYGKFNMHFIGDGQSSEYAYPNKDIAYVINDPERKAAGDTSSVDYKRDEKTNKFTITNKIYLDSSYTDTLLYQFTKKWILTNGHQFMRSNFNQGAVMGDALLGGRKSNVNSSMELYKNNTPLAFEDFENKEITAKVVNRFEGAYLSCLSRVFLEYSVKFSFRNGKLKVQIVDIFTHMVNPYDAGTPPNDRTWEMLIKAECEKGVGKLQDYLMMDFKKFLSDYREYLTQTHVKDAKKDDW